MPWISTPAKRALPLLLALLSLLTVLALGACAREEGTPGDETASARTYEVRGLVRQLPGGPGQELMIHHEAIPDLVDDRGEVVGMDAMTMGFPATDPALLEGVAVGDRILFELRLDWENSPALEIARLEVLPPETRLDFESEPTAAKESAEDGPDPAVPES